MAAKSGSAAGSAEDLPNYEMDVLQAQKALCIDFLKTFTTVPAKKGQVGVAKYQLLLKDIAERTQSRFLIELDDVQLFNPGLVKAIQQNTKRYTALFATAIDSLLPEPSRIGTEGDSIDDVLTSTRLANLDRNPDLSADGEPLTPEQLRKFLPPALLRKFEVRFAPLSSTPALPIRMITAHDIGKLVSVKCIVLRASDVKPLVEVAAYACDVCGWEAYQEVTGKTFMPLPKCVSNQCVNNKVEGKLRLQTRGSKFVRYQELRVQEMPDQVPVGHIPRSMTIVCRGETSKQVVPGDIVTISGIFLPTPFTGFQAIKAGLTADTYLEAHTVTKMKKASVEHLGEDVEQLINDVCDNDPYNLLSRSIAPEIFGLEDVKKALLLQLVGGVTQQQADGMKTRGDINICLMGDPGVAKSQLLKHIAKLAPRAVYTTGKGSSGVGLTAAVIRDPITNELTLEGGALVLADMGICCIDEFDKMDESDRTAIHEVMEQQTVSIAKAGITTTLNARTAILAAANPRYGRYNRRADADAHVSLMKNINLPAALLSRFDLLFLLLDEVDADNDKALAAHVTYVHQNEEHPPLDFEPFQPAFIRQYVSIAKHIDPFVPRELAPYIVEAFVDMRAKEKARANATGGRSTMTPRQLLSILRMSQALARLEMREEVYQKDVDEAIRLYHVSKASVMEPDGVEHSHEQDYVSKIWALVRDKAVADKTTYVAMADAEQLSMAVGYNKRHLEDFLLEYESLGLVQVNASRTRIDFVMLDE